MAALTQNALDEIVREKDYSPDNILPFLQNNDNFISVPVGIKRELSRLGYDGSDDELVENLKFILTKAGFSKEERRNGKKWLIDGVLPSPKYNYPLRLCFAFGLTGQAALDFLWKVCRVNGFNFRRAEDIVTCYCLETGRAYNDVNEILARYNVHTADDDYDESDATKRTQTLRLVFNNLADMDENIFFDLLCKNKKNFIRYSKTAHEEVLKLKTSLTSKIKSQIDDYNYRKQCAREDGYDYELTLYPEIIYAFELISKAAKGKNTPFGDIMSGFPQDIYLYEMFRTPEEATDKEHDKARKAFVLLYFADYALDPPPIENIFDDFVISLNDVLDRCGYGKLYPANPYDWLILKCIRSLEYIDQSTGDNPVELFNEVLIRLAEEQTI